MYNLLNTLFPPKCLFCNRVVGTVFCAECLEKCTLLEHNICRLRVKNGKFHIEVFSPFEYEGVVRECIKKSKYGPKFFSTLDILAKLGIYYTTNVHQNYEGFVVVPIPLNKRKYRVRGFNQAELIAKILSTQFKLRLETNLLIRSKQTETQYKFGREERFVNVKGAFKVNKERLKSIKESKILLIDDICTTGATLSEAALTFKNTCDKEVKAFTLSRRS